MLKAVIFDMDGVIIDSEPIHKDVEKKIFKRLGVTVTGEEHDSYVGVTSENMWNSIKQKHNLSESVSTEELIEMEVKEYIGFLLQHEDIKPITGVVELINELYKNNMKVALASSSVKKSIETVVKMFKLQKYFEVRISGEDILNGKPWPDIFLETAKHLNVAPSECLVIEDSKNGVSAAKAAGMKCIGFKNINSGNQDLSGADLIIDNYADISYKKILELSKKV